MGNGLLAPYRVLDLTDGRAELATFVLAGFGADVIKVEPPGGAASRAEGERLDGEPAELASLRFHAYNRGKRSVVADLDDPAGRAKFLRLVATADVVVENAGPGVMDARGLGFDALRAARPDLVYVAISPFGQDGPYADHLATDLTLAAMGGAMALNGDRDRRPVRVTVPQTWHHGAAESVVGTMIALERRRQSGEAQFVDVSVQAAVFWTGLNAMISAAIDGRDIERNGTVLQLSTLVTPLVYPCADGEVCLMTTSTLIVGIVPWMLEIGVVDEAWAALEDWSTFESRVLTAGATTLSLAEVRDKITELTRRYTKAELFEIGLARGLTLAPVNTAADVVAMTQLATRDYWDELVLPSGATLRAPGAFAKVSHEPVGWQRPAPRIGEHTAEVLADLPELPDPATTTGPATGSTPPVAPAVRVGEERSLPLAGVKVADFSWIGVGPISAKVLADHGATVVHIESTLRPDRLRLVGPFTDDIAGIDRCQFFGAFNTSKLSIQLNLRHPSGLDVARKLLAWCDVALDSFAAGTMDRLGLGYAVAKELNPSIIMATTCLFGQTGPASKLAGYGYHAAAISGFYEITGWDDRAPGGPFNAYTDTVAPRFLASTLLAALDHRRRTGEGCYLDQAQMESALHFISPELLGVQVSGRSPRRAGNLDPRCAPHDAYPCAGVDEWCAIAVETDEQWRALRGVLGDPAWAQDPALAGAAGRLAQRQSIDAHLAAWTVGFEPLDLMERLQRAGVPAGMVQRSSDHQEDPQLAHRRFFRPMLHPEMGEVPYEGHQYAIRGYDNGPRMPAPCIGQHTYEVLSDVLGLSDGEVTEILVSGACE